MESLGPGLRSPETATERPENWDDDAERFVEYVQTVNNLAKMKRLLDAGVERIYTDHPRLLLSLKAEGLKSEPRNK